MAIRSHLLTDTGMREFSRISLLRLCVVNMLYNNKMDAMSACRTA